MLHELWLRGCTVPPLEHAEHRGPLLLESMPGAVLRALGLPHKAYKNGRHATAIREQLLNRLPECSGVPISNLHEMRDGFMRSHDCLDSLVAAIAAALWQRDPSCFRHPATTAGVHPPAGRRRASPASMAISELEAARIEGWIYAPVALIPGGVRETP